MKTKIPAVNSLSFSLVAALVVYIMVLTSTGAFIIGKDVKEFELTAQKIENYKQKIILMSLLAESELDNVNYRTAEGINDSITETYDDEVYAADDSPLSKSTSVARKVLHDTNNHIAHLVNGSEGMLLYRSYVGKKLILPNQGDQFGISEHIFSKERCEYNQTCTIYAWPDQLSDRVIISSVFVDAIVGKKVIGISSPVYSGNKIVGDFVMLLYLDRTLSKGKNFSTSYDGNQKRAVISYAEYPLQEIAFTQTYVADNKTVFIYRYPLSKLLISHLWVYMLLTLIIFVLHFKNQESKQHKGQLDSALALASRDELTGLYNRKVLKNDTFIEATQVNPCAIVAIDGDKIKYVNDKYGHHIGDEAIKHIADSMRKIFRKSDFLVRTGGDEFLAILPDCAQSKAEELAQQLRDTVTRYKISYLYVQISVSTGVAVKTDLESLEEVIVQADSRLYEHKHKKSSRNLLPIDAQSLHKTS